MAKTERKEKRGEACKIRLLSSTGIADSELERASDLRVGDSKSLWGADQFKNLPLPIRFSNELRPFCHLTSGKP